MGSLMPRSGRPLTLGSSPRLRLSSGIASSCRGGWRVEIAKSDREAEEAEAEAEAGNRLPFANFILTFGGQEDWPQAATGPGDQDLRAWGTDLRCLASR